jgi:protein SCO1/2
MLILAALLIGSIFFAVYLWQRSGNIVLGSTLSEGAADIGGPFRLTDQNGVTVSSADYDGRYRLIYFGYSFCPDICPTSLEVISEAIAKLGRSRNRLVPLFITVDPERDTPKVLKDYLHAFNPRIVGLTGTPPQIAGVEKEFRIYARKHPLSNGVYAVDHSSLIYLMGPDGRFIRFYDRSVSSDELARSIAQITS